MRDRHAGNGAHPYDAPQRLEAVGHAVAATSAGISGYLAAHLVISLLTGVPRATPGRIETINLARTLRELEGEVADVLIVTAVSAERAGIDIGAAVARQLAVIGSRGLAGAPR